MVLSVGSPAGTITHTPRGGARLATRSLSELTASAPKVDTSVRFASSRSKATIWWLSRRSRSTMFMPILPRPTNPISIERASSWQTTKTMRPGSAATRRETGKGFPRSRASLWLSGALPRLFQRTDCSKSRPAGALVGFYVVFEHQVAQVLALEDARHRARQRNRQHLARLVVNSRFILGAQTERAHRRIVVSVVRAAGPERHAEGRLVDRDLEHHFRGRPPDRTELAVGAALLLYPTSPNPALEHVLGSILDPRLVGDIAGRRRAHARLAGRATDSLLHDRPQRRAVQAFRKVARLIDDHADRRIAVERRGVAGDFAGVGRRQDQDGLPGITVLIALDLVRVVLEGLNRGGDGRGRLAA